jgi:hypothetical protein
VAAIVYVMAVQVAAAVSGGNVQVLEDVRRIVPAASEPGAVITAAEIAQAVLHTVYMGTSNSTDATRRRALSLAQDVNAYHSWVSIDAAVDAVVTIFGALCGKVPQYLSNGECEYNLLQCVARASVICVVGGWSCSRCRRHGAGGPGPAEHPGTTANGHGLHVCPAAALGERSVRAALCAHCN